MPASTTTALTPTATLASTIPFSIPDKANTTVPQCTSTEIVKADLPPHFYAYNQSLCGLSFPQTTPLLNLTSCCDGPVSVSNGCFQYCTPLGNDEDFQECANKQLGLEEDASVLCMLPPTSGVGRHEVKWQSAAGLGLLVLGMLVWA